MTITGSMETLQKWGPRGMLVALFSVFFPLVGSPPRAIAQFDPRIPIPPSPQSAAPFEINVPGSYVLTGDRRCSGDGIHINADDVTIDLMGFTLSGPDSGASVGIVMNGRRNVEIRNGTLRNFGGRGIHDQNESGAAHGKRIIGMRVIANGKCGICLGGDGNIVRDCFVSANKGTGACVSGIIQENVFIDNETGGIACGERSLVIKNTVCRTSKAGIFARTACTIRDNIVSDAGNSGIYAEEGSLLADNVVTNCNLSLQKGYAGIKVIGDCIVRGNTARSNHEDNILVLRSGTIVEGNLATSATDSLGNGITFGRRENVATHNYAFGNTVDYAGEKPMNSADGAPEAAPPDSNTH
jgi:hypothetical protein